MNLGFIVEPNSKGQIVIPKSLRGKFGISKGTFLKLVVRGEGMYLQPIKSIVPRITKIDAYAKVLEKTQGTWSAGAEWKEEEKNKRGIELKASKKNKTGL